MPILNEWEDVPALPKPDELRPTMFRQLRAGRYYIMNEKHICRAVGRDCRTEEATYVGITFDPVAGPDTADFKIVDYVNLERMSFPKRMLGSWLLRWQNNRNKTVQLARQPA